MTQAKLKKKNLQEALFGIEAHYETMSGVFQLIAIGIGFAFGVVIDVLIFRYVLPELSFLGSLRIFIILAPIIFLPGYGIYLSTKLVRILTKQKTNEILESGKKIEKLKKVSEKKVQNIDEILSLSTDLHAQLRKVLYLARFKKSKDIRAYLSELIEETTKILINLRDDLLHSMGKKRETLSQSTQLLNELNTGNGDLQTGVDSQKVRIDIQISQFEELEKVLVKM